MENNLIPIDIKEKSYKQFLECFFKATEKIQNEYYHLPIAGQPLAIYRERVYCYELYHQLRVYLGDDYDFSLGGEVDKRSHPIMQGIDITNAKPDLLVHTPGNMGGNLIIIEVKPINAARIAIRKDLRTLTAFQRDGKYFKSLYLIYGDSFKGLNRIIREANSLQKEDKENRINLELIDLFWHFAPNEPATSQSWGIESKVKQNSMINLEE